MRTPGTLDLTAAQVRAVRDWAHARPPIARAWIFGSRAKGTARPDSDLDVAIEVMPEPGMTARETMERGLVWLEWESDLEDAVGIRVDMLLHDGDQTPKTKAGVDEAGVLVFDRSRWDALREMVHLGEEIKADNEMAERARALELAAHRRAAREAYWREHPTGDATCGHYLARVGGTDEGRRGG